MSLFYNSRTQRWEVIGKDRKVKASFGDDGVAKFESGVEVDPDSATVTRLLSFVGSSAALSAVGTATTAIATITAATGVAVGDKVFGNPRVALGGDLGLGGFHVPTTNVINALITNPSPDGGGSLPARGWDITVVRAA